MALKTGRSDLGVAIEGVFGAGKTTSLAFLLVWFALTTTHAVVQKENPAGQAIASMFARMHLPTALRKQLVRVVSTHAYEKEQYFPMDVISTNCREQVSKARLVVCHWGC